MTLSAQSDWRHPRERLQWLPAFCVPYVDRPAMLADRFGNHKPAAVPREGYGSNTDPLRELAWRSRWVQRPHEDGAVPTRGDEMSTIRAEIEIDHGRAVSDECALWPLRTSQQRIGVPEFHPAF